MSKSSVEDGGRQRAGRAETGFEVDFSRATVTRPDGTVLATYEWRPRGTGPEVPLGVIYLAHGMEEHAGRYDAMARGFAARGFVVAAHDHRGHGLTAQGERRDYQLGHVATRGGWNTMLSDLEARLVQVGSHYPRLPVVLLGHSMGSLLTREVAVRQGRRDAVSRAAGKEMRGPGGHEHGRVAAFVLLGTIGPVNQLFAAAQGRALAVGGRVRGWRHTSRVVRAFVFGAYNQHFRPVRTDADWTTRDQAQVDSYQADPFCGQPSSLALWRDVLDATLRLGSRSGLGLAGGPEAVPGGVLAGMSFLLVSGDEDMAGQRGSGVRRVAALIRAAGSADVTCLLIRGARHSLHEEIDRDEITARIAQWAGARV